MGKDRTVGEMKLCVRAGWDSSIGPGHPGMSKNIRIMEESTLSQEGVAPAQVILNRPVHSKTQLPLPTPDVDSPVSLLHPMQNPHHLARRVRDGETHFDASTDKRVARQYAYRSDYA